MLHDSPPAEYPVISAGIDWLTCTAKNSSRALELERVSDIHRRELNQSGEQVSSQSWLGFDGYKSEGLFFGRREHDVMLCLSGSLAAQMGVEAIEHCDNVSRLDLQVTIWTEGEFIELAREEWNQLKRADKTVGRPRKFAMVIGHPVGQTLYVNSRASDNFGRIYDKGVESKGAPAGLVWRYEVEFKRAVARHEALALVPQEQLSNYIGSRVHSWWAKRKVEPRFPRTCLLPEESGVFQVPGRDVLTWFNESLSKTVAAAIGKYGLKAVLESLHLQKLVKPLEGKRDGYLGTKENSGSPDTDTNTPFADYSERMVF